MRATREGSTTTPTTPSKATTPTESVTVAVEVDG
jgi:hypothetical protein